MNAGEIRTRLNRDIDGLNQTAAVLSLIGTLILDEAKNCDANTIGEDEPPGLGVTATMPEEMPQFVTDSQDTVQAEVGKRVAVMITSGIAHSGVRRERDSG